MHTHTHAHTQMHAGMDAYARDHTDRYERAHRCESTLWLSDVEGGLVRTASQGSRGERHDRRNVSEEVVREENFQVEAAGGDMGKSLVGRRVFGAGDPRRRDDCVSPAFSARKDEWVGCRSTIHQRARAPRT